MKTTSITRLLYPFFTCIVILFNACQTNKSNDTKIPDSISVVNNKTITVDSGFVMIKNMYSSNGMVINEKEKTIIYLNDKYDLIKLSPDLTNDTASVNIASFVEEFISSVNYTPDPVYFIGAKDLVNIQLIEGGESVFVVVITFNHESTAGRAEHPNIYTLIVFDEKLQKIKEFSGNDLVDINEYSGFFSFKPDSVGFVFSGNRLFDLSNDSLKTFDKELLYDYQNKQLLLISIVGDKYRILNEDNSLSKEFSFFNTHCQAIAIYDKILLLSNNEDCVYRVSLKDSSNDSITLYSKYNKVRLEKIIRYSEGIFVSVNVDPYSKYRLCRFIEWE